MRRSISAFLALLTGSVLVVSGVAAPATGASDEPVTITVEGALTLPAEDGISDEARVRLTGTEALTVDLELIDEAGTAIRQLATGLALTDPEQDGTFSGEGTVAATDLEAGSYTVRARAAGMGDVAAEAELLVAAEVAATQLTLTSSTPDVFPFADGDRDTVTLTAGVATPAPGAEPVTGTLTVSSNGTVVKTWSISTSDQQSFVWDGKVNGATVAGVYTATASVTTADGTPLSQSVDVTVRETRLESVTVTRDVDPAPAVDGFRDKVTFSVSSVTSTGKVVPVTGSLVVRFGNATVEAFPLTSSTQKITWGGRTGAKIVPGAYTVTVTGTGPESGSRSATANLTVSSKTLARISGVVRDGSTVKSVLADPGWGGTPTRVSTQWLLDGKPIAGATKPDLIVTKAMPGHKLSVRVVATVLGVKRTGTSEASIVYRGKSSEIYLRGQIEKLIATLPGDYTVKVSEVDGGRRSVSVGGAAAHEPASSSKLFIAWAVYRKIDEGTLALSTQLSSGLTVEQCLKAMIEPSDNYCAIELRNKVGLTYLNRLIDAGGYPSTHFWYANGRTKVTSATDLAKLISQLAQGKLLSADSTAKFLHLLKTQVWREAIPPGLPYNVRQASKPGTLWATGGMTETDVAFVWGSRTRYSIAVMGYNGATIPSITKISKLVYSYLQGSFPQPFVYDKQQMESTATVTLRTTAASSGAVVGSYPAGTKIEVIDSIRNWYYVRVAGKTGWMLNTNLTLRNPIL